MFTKAGVKPADSVVTYCHIGQQRPPCSSPHDCSGTPCGSTTARSRTGPAVPTSPVEKPAGTPRP